MTTEAIRQKAEQSVEQSLESGQSVTQGDMQVSRVSVKDAFNISLHAESVKAAKDGRRPLFRSFDLSQVGR